MGKPLYIVLSKKAAFQGRYPLILSIVQTVNNPYDYSGKGGHRMVYPQKVYILVLTIPSQGFFDLPIVKGVDQAGVFRMETA